MSTDLGSAPLQVFFAVVIGVSFIGFATGIGAPALDEARSPLHEHHAEVTDVAPEARPYWELRDTPRDQGPASFDADIAWLRTAYTPSRTDPVDLSGASKEAALAARNARRAYDGAPPVIPHPVRQGSTSPAECLVCHDEGMQIGNRRAPAHSHIELASCTQCHAMAEPNLPWERDQAAGPDPRAVTNSFVGLAPPEEGPRWTSIAPPVTPHKTFMRERCDSCHGVNGANAMRSTHPARQSCEQCHAKSSDLEQRP